MGWRGGRATGSIYWSIGSGRWETSVGAPVAYDDRKDGPTSSREGSTNGTTYPEPEPGLRRVAEQPSESPTGPA